MSVIKGEKIGAILIVGGGIAGMQAAMDAAESGFKVYIVDKKPAIGGKMAQLDKTFPTNDCAMCIMSPRLIDMSENDNIELITNAQLEKVEGEAGNFTVTVRKFARYVDEEKCNSCGKCVEVCSVTVPDEFNLGINGRKAIYRLFPQAVPDAFAIEKKEIPRCRAVCPIHTNVQGYVSLIAQGKFAEAYQINKEVNPFPSICGRVCHHPCERECLRNRIDEPVTITFLKRFAADYVAEHNLMEELEPKGEQISEDAQKVAIIGAGPSGLAAANDLAVLGYKVTVFEALSVAGGMLAVGIPSFRLPKSVLQKEIELIEKKGVDIKLNTRLGKDVTIKELFSSGYEAIYIAVGAHRGRKLAIEGEDLPQVLESVEFLRKINLGEQIEAPPRVTVVGGGNVAIDSARSALRLGAQQVTVLYRRSREEMPADEWEVEEAEEETGIKIEFLAAPVRVLSEDGKVSALECIRMKLGEPDESGRRRPIPIEDSSFTIPTDMVITAIGQVPDLSFLSRSVGATTGEGRESLDGLEITERETIKVKKDTLETNIPGVFAGGDAVTGPGTVVQAIAAGKKAARSIHRFLQGEDIQKPLLWETKTRDLPDLASEEIPEGQLEHIERRDIRRLTVPKRIHNFNEVQLGYDEETAIAQAQRCLNCGVCSECRECVKVCDPGAIFHEQEERLINLKVGSIILAGGYETYPAEKMGEYGYGRYANVVTALEFERFLSASGPTKGAIKRPSDGREPHKIAFIQCVGSRDFAGRANEYCCSVGCMYAIKQAIIAKEHSSNIEVTIFFIDIRAHGKGYESYYQRAAKEYGVRFIRSLPSSVKEMQRTKNLLTKYIDVEATKISEEEFDLVVLSMGLQCPSDFAQLGSTVDVERNEYGFVKTDPFSTVDTSRAGIFACGTIQGPKDIPAAVVHASAATASAGTLLAKERGKMIVQKEYPPEKSVADEQPRVGVFVCHCGNNIAGVVDVEGVAEFARQLDGVVHAETLLFSCSPDGLGKIKNAIAEHQLNRVVVASCSPRTHEPLFRETLRETGLNRYLFEMANIRDQCSWVHAKIPQAATDKSKRLVKSAVAKALLLEPIEQMMLPNTQAGLVIGGGLAGMTAALSLAENGFLVHLIEKETFLGGSFRNLRYTLYSENPQQYLQKLIEKVKNHPNIELHLSSEITEISGFVGNFQSKIATPIEKGGGEVRQLLIEHGVVIVATGGREYKPEEYLYGKVENVITQWELENRIADGNLELFESDSVVMIQCVGCRNEDRTYCSRICCSMAIKNALKIKESNPDIPVTLLYKDIRTFGFREKYYQKAREKGVMFIPYDDEHKPQVAENQGELKVSVFEPTLDGDYVLEPTLLVLSSAIISGEDNEKISDILMLPQDENGFFLEAHIKLRPVEFASEGIFLCGLAHSPQFAEESIAQARAAASRAMRILSKKELEIEGIVSVVNTDKCVACLTCVRVCPYQVPVFDESAKAISIEPAKCHGCGICVSECPAKALNLRQYKDEQILEMIDALLW